MENKQPNTNKPQETPKKEKFRLGNAFDNKRFTSIFSVIASVILWLVVVTVIDPEQSQTFPVRISYDYDATAYKTQGLDMIKPPSRTINVRVTGDNSII